MRLVLYVFGYYVAVIGVLLCVKPALGKRLADWWMKDKLNRAWAVVTGGLGVLLILAAPASRATGFIHVLGVLSILKGIYLLVAARSQLIGIVNWWNRLSQKAYRLWGLVTLVIGVAILATL